MRRKWSNVRLRCVFPESWLISGVLDSELRPDLTVEQALALGRRAILAAAHRDAFSGGSINCIQPTRNLLTFSVPCYERRMEIYW